VVTGDSPVGSGCEHQPAEESTDDRRDDEPAGHDREEPDIIQNGTAASGVTSEAAYDAPLHYSLGIRECSCERRRRMRLPWGRSQTTAEQG
jgi:hypothetical protein